LVIAVVALVGVAVAVGALAVFSAAFRAQSESDAAAAWELHTVQVQLETERLLAAVQGAEASQRGFLLTDNSDYLASYESASRTAKEQVAKVKRLTADNPAQQKSLDLVGPLVDQRLDVLAEGIALHQRSEGAAAIDGIRGGRGKQIMDALRQNVTDMASEEANLLALRRTASAEAAGNARGTIYRLLGLAACLLAGAAFVGVAAMRNATRAREAATRSAVAEQVRDQLEARVEEATRALRESEGRLLQVQKMEAVGKLTGGIAHDFNNMLAIIIGSLDMAERRLSHGDSAIMRFITSAMEGATRAALLTQRLLAFSRQQPLAPAVLDPNAMVAGMSELLRRTLGGQIKLETILAGGLWRCKADRNQLENAIVNLAVNARDAMPKGGSLTLETANAHLDDAYVGAHTEVTAGQYVAIAITDNGGGMTADIIARAFDPFFTTKPVGQGTGLGLSQVFGFVKQSGGHVKIYSEVGHGTTVKIYLPRCFGAQEEAAEKPVGPIALPEGRADEIVLVVEDEDRVRRMSVDALRDLGYTVHHASGGAEALKVLATQQGIKLLFTDIVMPDMSGRQLADLAQARMPGLKVLYTTGYTRNAVVHDGTLDPGVAFLAKPFTIALLAAKVRQVLDQPATAP
jgi:signal transduction histidine kinase/ActR/RegA family two-component response regulator